MRRLVPCLFGILALSPLAPVRAGVQSLSLGISVNCPYGLAG